jgi:nitroreductase
MTGANHERDLDTGPLGQAVVAASLAPSIFNTQPWRWHVANDSAELYCDRSRQLQAADPNGRLMIISCGGALHHALIALAAEGYIVETEYFPDEADSDLLAPLRLAGKEPVNSAAMRQYQSLLNRHTDRRPFADEPVPETALSDLRKAVESKGAHLQTLRNEQVITLIAAVSWAENTEMADPAYRAELAQWTNRPAGAEDGIPVDTAAGPTLRRVPVREFTLDVQGAQPDADPSDMYARYALLSTDGDTPTNWLRAGEALSTVLIAAVEAGLAVSPMSGATEVPASREQLRALLSGIGYPQIALRIGITDQPSPVPAAGRRNAASILDSEEKESRS